MIKLRLDKMLSHAGFGSRKEVAVLIRSGRVFVNGMPARDPGMNVEPGTASVDGKAVQLSQNFYLMMHKPAGILTQAESPTAPSVLDLLPEIYQKRGCMPVGRLDKDTTGLLLLTTDGVLAHRLIAPKRHVDKVYHVWCDGNIGEEDKAAFLEGIRLKDFTAKPAVLEILAPQEARVTVHEGKYHQIKRMFGARGLNVVRLHRESFGPIDLPDDLHPGEYRELTDAQIAALYAAAEMEQA